MSWQLTPLGRAVATGRAMSPHALVVAYLAAQAAFELAGQDRLVAIAANDHKGEAKARQEQCQMLALADMWRHQIQAEADR